VPRERHNQEATRCLFSGVRVEIGKLSRMASSAYEPRGTNRDVVRQLKRQPVEIPVIVVCAPGCSEEYRDYLAALNIRAFDYVCHPYRQADLERILHSAISVRPPSMRSRDDYSNTAGCGSDKLRAV
jgi:DNA-binding NtrC family response regulator